MLFFLLFRFAAFQTRNGTCLTIQNSTFVVVETYWDSSQQWSASIEVCACSCSGVLFLVCEFEFRPAFDKNTFKVFEFCPAFEKKFALDKSQSKNQRITSIKVHAATIYQF